MAALGVIVSSTSVAKQLLSNFRNFRSVIFEIMINLTCQLKISNFNIMTSLFQFERSLNPENRVSRPYSLSPLIKANRKALPSPPLAARKLYKGLFKMMNAHDLQDELNQNLLNWSSLHVLCVFVWAAATREV